MSAAARSASASTSAIAAIRPARALELARALAWTAGVAMVVASVLLPFAHRHLYVAAFKDDLRTAVDRVIERQKTELVDRERFDPAAAAMIAAEDGRIEAAARVLGDGRLLVRAMTSARAVETGWLPALIFERIVDPDGKATEGTWPIDG